MKRIILFALLLGVAAFGLTACLPEDEILADSADQTGVAVGSTSDSVNALQPESMEVAEATQHDEAEVAQPSTVSSEMTGNDVRGPITILGNADFTAENGVVGGTGTPENPYIIAGWQIVVPSGEYYGVRIENVTAQFVLRGLSIQNATERMGAGIRIGFASGGVIEGCSVANSMHGITIVSSTDIAVNSCILYVSGRGLQVVGESKEQYRHVISDNNLYNNNPIYYFYGLDGETISGLTAGHLTVAGSRNVTISNNEVVNGDGLLLAFVDDSTVRLNLVHRLANVITDHGIHLYESNNNEVVSNLVKNNRLAGIQLTLADGNVLSGNVCQANDTGIRILASDDNVIQENSIFTCVTGILLVGASSGNEVVKNQVFDDQENTAQGISLEAAMFTLIDRNLIFGSEIGIILEPQAAANTLTGNTIVAGAYGISIAGTGNTIDRNLLSQFSRAILFPETFQRSITQGNTFRGNVLADNANHVYTNMDSTGNWFSQNAFLNVGPHLVNDQGTGNQWTKSGVGNFWGFNSVSDADGDGIGDIAVRVVPSNVDDTAPLASINARELGLGIVGTLALETMTIETEDGERIEVPAYVASEQHERATGFRGFPTELIAGFPGILFVYDAEVEVRFTMSTVLFDLDIAFFDANGDWVGGTTMTAQDTALYAAGAPFQYALELPVGSFKELGIGVGSTLLLP
jgi:parallel beta-helix repeat protein